MIQFNSAWQTIVTMSAIILSSGGVFLGLWLVERPFGIVMSGLGIIALAGVVVNNNIVLIDTFNEFRKKGYDARQAAFHAGLARFRPVVLAAVTTILGLVPMVFELTIQFGERSILGWCTFLTMVDRFGKHCCRRADLCDNFDIACNPSFACFGRECR